MIPALTKGGAERVAVDLANASVRSSHSVTVVVGRKIDDKILRVRLDPAVKVIYMTEKLGGKIYFYCAGLAWIFKKRKWLATQDVLHLHLTQMAVLGTVMYAMRTFTRGVTPAIVETYHAVGMKIPDGLRSFHAWNCRWRDGIALMALDSYWQAFIQRYQKSLVELIPNGVDPPVGPPLASDVRGYLDEIGVPRYANLIIGTVGQFRTDRQPIILAKILVDVLKRTPYNVHVLMCGTGPELESVKALVRAEGLSKRFTLPGMVNEPLLAMSSMSIYLTVNVGNITGIAALEAAFCGSALVGLQTLSDWQDDERCWIWSSTNPACVSQRIQDMLADSENLEKVSKMQYQYVRSNHTIKTACLRYIRFYNQVIESVQNKIF
jgi:glycosyltransferase involved in cell wall biosynthesis